MERTNRYLHLFLDNKVDVTTKCHKQYWQLHTATYDNVLAELENGNTHTKQDLTGWPGRYGGIQ